MRERTCVLTFVFFFYYLSSQLFTLVPRWEALQPDTQKLYHRDRDLYEKIARKGAKTLYFARSAQEGETWVSVCITPSDVYGH